MKFRKKPVVVEAIRFTGHNDAEILRNAGIQGSGPCKRLVNGLFWKVLLQFVKGKGINYETRCWAKKSSAIMQRRSRC
jgi:hypothetical protein